MVSLSKAKRLDYEKAQPQFWRYAGEEGDNTQRQWFKGLLEDKNYVMFTVESDEHLGWSQICMDEFKSYPVTVMEVAL